MTRTTITEHKIHGRTVETLEISTPEEDTCILAIQRDTSRSLAKLSKNEAQRLIEALQKWIEA